MSGQKRSPGLVLAAVGLVAGALVIAGIGFVNSFEAIRAAVEPSFGPLAWTVPVLVDVGIFVFTGIDLLFTRLGMRVRRLRLVPWALIGATIWLNVAGEATSVGVVAHAAAPLLWAVTVELGAHYLRARAGLDGSGPVAMNRIRWARWVLAPASTLVIRRWMILQDEPSYSVAYGRWWARRQALWELQDAHGRWMWRFKAPRKVRGFYKYGHLGARTGAGLAAPVAAEAAASKAPAGRRSKRPGSSVPSSKRDVVRRLAAEHPDWKNPRIAEEAGCDVRTVRRHLAGTARPAVPAGAGDRVETRARLSSNGSGPGEREGAAA